MKLSDVLLNGIPWNPFLAIALFLLGILTLLFSMIVASRLAGGIDFGSVTSILPKAAGILAAITLVNFFTCGILIAGPIWFLGLMFLFDLEYREARILAKVNWAMNLLWKILILFILL